MQQTLLIAALISGNWPCYQAGKGPDSQVIGEIDRSSGVRLGGKRIAFADSAPRFAYPAEESGKVVVISEDGKGKPYDEVRDILFSPSGKLSYFARTVDKWNLVLDGTEGPKADRAQGISWSRDGKQFSYLVSNGVRDWQLVSNGVAGESHDRVSEPGYSQEGSLLYSGADDKEGFIVINGERKATPVGVVPLSRPYIAAQHVAYFAGEARSGKRVVVLDGKILAERFDGYALVGDSGSLISPDGKSVAYACVPDSRRVEFFVVWNERKWGPYANADAPVFSPDGRQIAFLASKAGQVGRAPETLYRVGVQSEPAEFGECAGFLFDGQGEICSVRFSPKERKSLWIDYRNRRSPDYDYAILLKADDAGIKFGAVLGGKVLSGKFPR